MGVNMKLKDEKKGFTLLELLIVIGLLAAVVLTIYSLYEFGTKTFMQQTNEITVGTELRDAMDLILMECRKGQRFSNDDRSITTKDNIVTFELDDKLLKMIKTDRSTGERTETVLCYSVSSFRFDVGTKKIDIAICSDVKDSKGNEMLLEATHFIRGSN